MAVSKQQQQQALFYYPTALKATREEYLRGLQKPNLSEEETNQIWAASFVLQYMAINHEKYIQLLNVLKRDEKTKALLSQLLGEITIDPAEDLQGFVDQAQSVMKSEKVLESLSQLAAGYNRKKNYYNGVSIASVIAVILIAILTIALTFSTPILPILLIAIAIPFFVVTAFVCRLNSFGPSGKKHQIMNSMSSLTMIEKDYVKLTDHYDYKIEHSENNSLTETVKTITKTHDSRPTKELRASFFQSLKPNAKPLNQEVQEKFNQLSLSTKA